MEAVVQRVSSLQTFTTSYISAQQKQTPTPDSILDGGRWYTAKVHGNNDGSDTEITFKVTGLNSTGKGILIGMLSAFGSAALVALILAIVYFFRFTPKGRIFLDRIGRPGEYDDEQAFLREEEDALAEMDDSQKAEYMRAKGIVLCPYA